MINKDLCVLFETLDRVLMLQSEDQCGYLCSCTKAHFSVSFMYYRAGNWAACISKVCTACVHLQFAWFLNKGFLREFMQNSTRI